MRWIALAAIACFSMPAVAQTDSAEPSKIETQIVDITTAIDIYGHVTRPKGMIFQGKRRPVFKPLNELKRNFLPRTVKTGHDIALR